jgi:hypothetical protein
VLSVSRRLKCAGRVGRGAVGETGAVGSSLPLSSSPPVGGERHLSTGGEAEAALAFPLLELLLPERPRPTDDADVALELLHLLSVIGISISIGMSTRG